MCRTPPRDGGNRGARRQPMGGSAADYGKLYDDEYARWAAVVKASGAKID